MRHLSAVAVVCASVLLLAPTLTGRLKSEAFLPRPVLKSTPRTANQRAQTTTPAPPDTCLQDDSDGSVLQFNSATGDYQYTNCGGVTLSGTGSVIRRGSIVTLQQYG